MAETAKELIRNRTSTRTFQKRQIDPKDLAKVEKIIHASSNPFGVPVDIRLLDAKENKLTSPVIVGGDKYIAAKAPRVPNHETAIGYQFQDVLLDVEALGLGNVWLAATLSRPTFESAMEVTGNEVMPAASPIGYPAEKRSMRESMMRKAIKADTRLPYEELFYKGNFDTPLKMDTSGQFGDALEAVRLAPSAGNKQPWRAVVDGDTVHFYEKKSKGMENRLGDIQKVDVGIALAQFERILKEDGISGQFVSSDPGLTHDDDTEYIVSYRTN